MTNTKWTLDDAIAIIQKLQPIIHELGYHITLGGGVLNNKESNKDLDLFILRKNNSERKLQRDCILAIQENLPGSKFKALRDSPDYGPDEDFHFNEAQIFTLASGRRIDVFVQ